MLIPEKGGNYSLEWEYSGFRFINDTSKKGKQWKKMARLKSYNDIYFESQQILYDNITGETGDFHYGSTTCTLPDS